MDIAYGDLIVLSVTAKDAATSNKRPVALATSYRATIAQSITAHRDSIKWTTLAKEIFPELLAVDLGARIIAGPNAAAVARCTLDAQR
jgi:hypothetical protein